MTIIANNFLLSDGTTVEQRLGQRFAEMGDVRDDGAKGDGNFIDDAALNKRLGNAGRHLFPKNKIFKISKALKPVSNSHIIMPTSTLLVPSSDFIPGIQLHGTPPATESFIALTSDGLKNKDHIQSSADYKIGQFIRLESDDLITNSANSKNTKRACIRKIIGKTSNLGVHTYYLHKPLNEDYVVANGAKTGIYTKFIENVILETPRFNRLQYQYLSGIGISLKYCYGCIIICPGVFSSKLHNTTEAETGNSYTALKFFDCLDCVVYDPISEQIAWYGIETSGCSEDITTNNGKSLHSRHGASVNWSSQKNLKQGQCWNIKFYNFRGYNQTKAGGDTHDDGQEILYSGCHFINSGISAISPALQVRNKNTRIEHCLLKGASGDGFRQHSGGGNSLISFTDALDNGRSGFSAIDSHLGKMTLIESNAKHNGYNPNTPSLRCGVGLSYGKVIGGEIIDNNGPAFYIAKNAQAGIQNVRISVSEAPYSTNQSNLAYFHSNDDDNPESKTYLNAVLAEGYTTKYIFSSNITVPQTPNETGMIE